MKTLLILSTLFFLAITAHSATLEINDTAVENVQLDQVVITPQGMQVQTSGQDFIFGDNPEPTAFRISINLKTIDYIIDFLPEDPITIILNGESVEDVVIESIMVMANGDLVIETSGPPIVFPSVNGD